MSGIPTIELGDLDGTQRWVKTSGFVRWVDDVSTNKPYQRVGLGDDSTNGSSIVCTVWTGDIVLEKGVGYRLGGLDNTYEKRDEVQLQLGAKSWADEFWRPDE